MLDRILVDECLNLTISDDQSTGTLRPVATAGALWNGNLDITARPYAVNRSNAILDAWPTCSPDYYDSDPAFIQILLVPEILVRRDQYLKACCFCLG